MIKHKGDWQMDNVEKINARINKFARRKGIGSNTGGHDPKLTVWCTPQEGEWERVQRIRKEGDPRILGGKRS